jgi:hypothetical protein
MSTSPKKPLIDTYAPKSIILSAITSPGNVPYFTFTALGNIFPESSHGFFHRTITGDTICKICYSYSNAIGTINPASPPPQYPNAAICIICGEIFQVGSPLSSQSPISLIPYPEEEYSLLSIDDRNKAEYFQAVVQIKNRIIEKIVVGIAGEHLLKAQKAGKIPNTATIEKTLSRVGEELNTRMRDNDIAQNIIRTIFSKATQEEMESSEALKAHGAQRDGKKGSGNGN